MSQQTLNTLLSGIAAFGAIAAVVVGGVTIWLAIRHNRQRRREREEDRRLAEEQKALAEEQLKLARDQDARRPLLKLCNVRLEDSGRFAEIEETRRVRKEWINTLESYERAKERAERRSEEEKNKPPLQRAIDRSDYYKELSEVGIDPRALPPVSWEIQEQREYEGPYPDKVLTFDVVNEGRVAAKDYSLRLYIEGEYLRPFSFPGLDSVETPDAPTEEGFYELEPMRVSSQDFPLLPGRKKGDLYQDSYQIAVLVNSPGKAKLRYELDTSQGDHWKGALSVSVF